MVTSIEWYQEKVSQLYDDSKKQAVLSELKTAILCLNSSELTQIASSLELEIIFDCLNSSDKKEIRDACDILYPLLSSFEPVALLDKYEYLMTRALAHPSPKLRTLVLKELNRAVHHSSQLAERICREEVLHAIVETVGGTPREGATENLEEEEEEGIAVRAGINILCTLGCSPRGILFFSRGSPLLEIVKRLSQHNDIVKYRFYEILVEIAANSEEGLTAVVDSGLLNPMIKEAIDGNSSEGNRVDILVQANALELLGKLAAPEHGAHYINDVGAAETLAGILARSQEDFLSSSLLLPGLVKFFGGIAHIRPKEILSAYPTFPNALFEGFESSDLSIVGVTVETIGYIGVTPQGKQALYTLYGTQMTNVMKRLGKMIMNFPTPYRVRAMNSLASLMSLKTEDQDEEQLAITKRWFEGLCPTKPDSTQWDAVELISSMCHQPFPELQLAGYQVLQCLAILPWGQRMFASCPGLLEFLTSYDTEMGFVRESKHNVSEALLESPSVSDYLSEVQLTRLQKFVQLGPHGKLQAPTEVAVDGAS